MLIGARPDDVITLQGDLVPAPFSLDSLRATVASRPDVKALEAEAGVARAETDLANVKRWPAIGIWFAYDLDEHDNIVLGGLRVTLPLWNREQGALASSRVKQKTAMRKRDAIVSAATRQLVDVYEQYTHERDAVDIMRRDVLPAIDDAQKLVERSIDAGQITDRGAPRDPSGGDHRTPRAHRPRARARQRRRPGPLPRGTDAMIARITFALLLIGGCGDKGREPGPEHDEHHEKAAPATAAHATDQQHVTIAPEMIRDLRITTAKAEARAAGERVSVARRASRQPGRVRRGRVAGARTGGARARQGGRYR